MAKPGNDEIAGVLRRIADLLEAQDANPHRIRAYRNGADAVRSADKALADVVLDGNEKDLEELPGIGEALARIIANYVRTGRSSMLDRLEGEVSPEELFSQVPGIGDTLAERIAQELDIHTLEELEEAAHDGRLAQVEGIGEKRLKSVRVSLAGMLSQAVQRRMRETGAEDKGEKEHPDVETLLEVDAEYRRKAEADELKKIAPKRLNPKGEAWLPVMHTQQEGWNFTALYSNTARAHDLGKTHDWVVIYYDRDRSEDQATVVTASQGPLSGKRVVRGREAECREYYQAQSPS